jgi:hypothetical protein
VEFVSPWGNAADALGRERPSEGNASGPMSFLVDGKGRAWILDQVNGRIVRRDRSGAVERTFPIDRPNAQDLALGEDGSVAILDRYGDADVAIYDDAGNYAASLPLVGDGVESAGLVTGVVVEGTNVYAEVEHGVLVRVGDTSGNPAEPRETIPGRPSRDGTAYLKAGITDARTGRTYVIANDRPSGAHRFTRELRFEGFVPSIVLLDSDKAGTIYFAVEVGGSESADGGGEEEPVIVLACLDGATGEPKGSAELPANTLPEETLRDLAVLDGGGVVLSRRTEEGVRYERYDCE